MACKRDEFNQWLLGKSGRQTSMISREYGEKIIRYLREKREKGDSAEVKKKFDPQFRFHVNKKKFHILNVVGLGDILCLPVKDKTKASHAMLGQHRQVIFKEDMYDVIEAAHTQKSGEKHRGYKGTFKKINATYCNIPREVVHKYVELCTFCQKYHSCFVPNLLKRNFERKNSKSSLPVKKARQDIQMDFLARCQIDVIDMTSQPDGKYQYIGHFMDHHTKFNVLFPLRSKQPVYVARKLCRFVLGHFGLPRILYSSQGRDFVSEMIICLFELWSTDVQIIGGNPKLPIYKKFYTVVEQRQKTIISLIETIRAKHNQSNSWSVWLPGVQYSLNTNVFEADTSPAYDTVFKRRPRLFTYSSSSAQVLKEEDVSFEDDSSFASASLDVAQMSDFDTGETLLPIDLTTSLTTLVTSGSPGTSSGSQSMPPIDLDLSGVKYSMPVIASTLYPFLTSKKTTASKRVSSKYSIKSPALKRTLFDVHDDSLTTHNGLAVKHSVETDISSEYIYPSATVSSQHLATTSTGVTLDNDTLGLIGIVTLNSPMTQINTANTDLSRKSSTETTVMNMVTLSTHETSDANGVASVVDISTL